MAGNINPRRKITTYGRVSRKENFDFKYFAPHLASEQPLLTLLAKTKDLQQEDGHIPVKLQAYSSDTLDVRDSGVETARFTRSKSRPSGKAESKPKPLHFEQKPSFDMESSKREDFRKRDLNVKLPEKKGDTEYKSEAEAVNIVPDDQRVNQVSAFGAILHHKTKLKKNKCPSSEALRNAPRDQHRYTPFAPSHLREPDTKNPRPNKTVSSELQANLERLAPERSHKQKISDLDVNSHQMQCSSSDSSSTEIGGVNTGHKNVTTFQPKIPLSISPGLPAIGRENSKNTSHHQGPAQLPAASTTHQRELWDMLLKGDSRGQTPLSPKPSSGTGALGDDISKSRSNNHAGRGSQGTTSDQGRKRRRLVDHLNLCETGIYENVSILIDQESILKDSGRETNSDSSNAATDHLSCESHTLIPSSQDHVHNATSLRNPSMPVQDGRLKVTYARQRSFVDDDAQGAMADAAISTDSSQLQTGWGNAEADVHIKSDESSEDIVNSQGTMMRSIYELRKAGSNARAVRNMEALLDDIRGETGLSLEHKVSRLLQLIIKLQDIPYCRLFIEQGLDLRLLSCLDLDRNMALRTLVAAAILHLLVPSAYLSKLHQTKDTRLSKLFVELLDQEGNLKILVKKIGFMKPGIDQANFEKSWEGLLKSAAWGSLSPLVVTARVISLRCLEYLARHTCDSSQPAAGIPPYVFWNVARLLDPNFSVSVRKPNPRTQLDLQLALSVLDIYTIGKSAVIEESIWKGETILYLKSFLPRLSTWREEEIGKLRTLTLRLYLNLMNNRPKLCEAFATTHIVNSLLLIVVSNFRRLAQDGCDQEDLLLDDLILALGSMINLAEWCDTAPRLVMGLRFEDSSFLDVLLMLYASKQLEAQEVSQMIRGLAWVVGC